MKKMLILMLVLVVPSVMFGAITTVNFGSYATGPLAKGSAPAPFIDDWDGNDPVAYTSIVTSPVTGSYGTQALQLASNGSQEPKNKIHLPVSPTNNIVSVVWKKTGLGSAAAEDKMMFYSFDSDNVRNSYMNVKTDESGNILLNGTSTFTFSADTWGLSTYEFDLSGGLYRMSFKDENGDQGTSAWFAAEAGYTWDSTDDFMMYANRETSSGTPGTLTIDAISYGDAGLTVIPEPITIALLGLGGLLIRRKR